jgi:uncharacterized membrane protein (DUF485 family)
MPSQPFFLIPAVTGAIGLVVFGLMRIFASYKLDDNLVRKSNRGIIISFSVLVFPFVVLYLYMLLALVWVGIQLKMSGGGCC